jgi:hypothetical protein
MAPRRSASDRGQRSGFGRTGGHSDPAPQVKQQCYNRYSPPDNKSTPFHCLHLLNHPISTKQCRQLRSTVLYTCINLSSTLLTNTNGVVSVIIYLYVLLMTQGWSKQLRLCLASLTTLNDIVDARQHGPSAKEMHSSLSHHSNLSHS